MMLAWEVESLKKEIKDLKDDTGKIDHILTELEVIKQRIKNL